MSKRNLTILAPTYNRFVYTKYTFDTIAQYTDWDCVEEVLVGDAGSTDGTRELVQQYDFVRMYDVEPGSVAKNVRRGAELAQTEYILMAANDIAVSPGWNRKALDAIKLGMEHDIWIVNYDMPDRDMLEAISARLPARGGGTFVLAMGEPRGCIEGAGFSLQRSFQAGGLWVTTRELLLSETQYGRLGDMVTGAFYGMWYWHVFSFQDHIAIRTPRLGCLLWEMLPEVPSGSSYQKYRLDDPLVRKFLEHEDPAALRREYVEKGWMRDVKYV